MTDLAYIEARLESIENALMGRTTSETHRDTMIEIKRLDREVDDLKNTNAALLRMLRNTLDGKLPPCLRLKP